MNNKIQPYNNDNYNSNFNNEDAYLRAKRKVEKLTAFYWHLVVYIAVNAFLIFIIGKNRHEEFWSFGTFSTAIFWGIGLAFHFLNVFGKSVFFGKDWEQRKIEEYMRKNQEKTNRYE